MATENYYVSGILPATGFRILSVNSFHLPITDTRSVVVKSALNIHNHSVMLSPAFVHLRLHSEYSITDGMLRIDEAVAAAKSDGMPALALTDLSNFSGLVKFYKAARGKGIKPVAGVDVFITNDADRDRPYRLLLLCQSVEGYHRLCRLLSRAYLSNQYRERPELRREWFREEGTEGLIALSGAHLGDVGSSQATRHWHAKCSVNGLGCSMTVITLNCSAQDSPTKNLIYMQFCR
jgi:DNA polymerase III alpha subunit (gram-positive type)